MLLKIGELAKRTGLTVRTLHHYDAIDLLSPSARTDAGYRLYDQNDIARLHQIQAMRSFGMSLSDIGAYLTRPDLPLAAVVARQIAMLDQQIAQASLLRGRLSRLHGQLAAGQGPDLADWLTTLEQMTMFDKYFTQDELQQLPLYTDAQARSGEWKALVAQVNALIEAGTRPADPRAQALATAVDDEAGARHQRQPGAVRQAERDARAGALGAGGDRRHPEADGRLFSPRRMKRSAPCTATTWTTTSTPTCAPTSASAAPSGRP